MADDPSGVLTVAETAKMLKRSTEQVRRYLREGSLRGRRLGGQWFVLRADAEAFLRQRHEGAELFGGFVAGDPDPLAAAIAVGGSGGGDVAVGTIAYLQTLVQRRRP